MDDGIIVSGSNTLPMILFLHISLISVSELSNLLLILVFISRFLVTLTYGQLVLYSCELLPTVTRATWWGVALAIFHTATLVPSQLLTLVSITILPSAILVFHTTKN